MKFSTRKDMEAPIDAVFDNLSNFAAFERAALRRGAEVSGAEAQDGMQAWQLRFPLRGRTREITVVLLRSDRPETLAFAGESRSFDIRLGLTLLALSRARTRLGVELDVRPRSRSARLLLQTMRLTKAGYQRRFDGAVEQFAKKLERDRFGPRA